MNTKSIAVSTSALAHQSRRWRIAPAIAADLKTFAWGLTGGALCILVLTH